MIPIVAALSYEALKALAKGKGKCIAFIRAPGLWMQKFTTKEPDDEMLEVAIVAFKRVLEMDERPVPKNVVWCAEFPQGEGTWKEFDGFYFCY